MAMKHSSAARRQLAHFLLDQVHRLESTIGGGLGSMDFDEDEEHDRDPEGDDPGGVIPPPLPGPWLRLWRGALNTTVPLILLLSVVAAAVVWDLHRTGPGDPGSVPPTVVTHPPQRPKPQPDALPPRPSYWPPGITAMCRDGWLSSSGHRHGTCSGHTGVAYWSPHGDSIPS